MLRSELWISYQELTTTLPDMPRLRPLMASSDVCRRMDGQRGDFCHHFSYLCAAEQVRERLPVSGWTSSRPYIYSACLALVHFKSLSFKFSWKSSDHTSYEKRFLRSLSNLLSSHCPSKKVNICGHIWKMHDSPIICLPSPNGSFAVPGLSAAFASSWQGLSQSKYLQLGENMLLPPASWMACLLWGSLQSIRVMHKHLRIRSHLGSMQDPATTSPDG